MSAVVKTAAPEWRTVRLGDVLTLHYGKALPASDRNPEGKIPVYGANGIKDHTDKSLCDGSTLVIGRKGSAGEITRVEGAFWPLDVTYYTSHDRGQLNFDYMAYALSMLDLPSLARGVKPGINRNDIYAIEVRLPPLDEQKRIVAVLDQAFAALDRARAHAEANLGDAQRLLEALVAEKFSARESWPREDLGSRVRFIDYRGKTPPKSESGIRLITAKNVRMGFVKDDPAEFVPEGVYDAWMTRGIPKRGDVLFTTEAPLANVAQLETDDKVVIGQRLITMQTDCTEIDRPFLKWALLSPQMQKDIQEKGTGATVLGIKASLLKKIPFFIPSAIDVQKKIAQECEMAFAARDRMVGCYARKLEDLANLRQSVLQKAFSGQLT